MHHTRRFGSHLGGILLVSLASLTSAQNSVFTATEDARVRQDQRTTNFGTSELGVETSMRAPGLLFERSLLRFVVSGVDPSMVDCVTLELTATVPGDCHFEVREVSGAWDENTVDWATMPDGNGRRMGSWSEPVLEGEVLQIPLAPGVFAAGDGTYDLVLVEVLGGGSTRIGLDSREGLAPPTLIIGCNGLMPRAGISSSRIEGELPFTPEILSFLPADVSSAIWDFGDGSPTQNALLPSHTYTNAGRYDISVTASSPAGVITVTRPDFFFAHRADGMDGTVVSITDINDSTVGGLFGLMDADYFGRSVGTIGDLDGDGIPELIVGAVGDDSAGDGAGAVYILFMRIDGSVRASTKITEGLGGFSGDLDAGDGFGREVAPIGDLDGDGILDVAVGANGDDDAAQGAGSVWILFLDTEGGVKGDAKITSDLSGNLLLNVQDQFGRGIANVGDLDGDGVQELVVGATGDDSAGNNLGTVWVLFMNTDGSVKTSRKINAAQGGLTSIPVISPLGWWFGMSVSPIGDVNGDGICDIVVGALLDNAIPRSSGAAVVILLNNEGGAKGDVLINGALGGGLDDGELWANDQFGGAVAGIGDVDGDGIPDIAVSAIYDDDNLTYRTDLFNESGAVYIIFLNSDGSVRDYQKISATRGGVPPMNNMADRMGEGLAGLGDLDGDGDLEILVGSRFSDLGGPNQGNVRIMHLNAGNGTPASNVVELGCGINPVDSMVISSGIGRIGASITFGIDNPLGTQAVGSIPFIALTGVPDPNFPCGTLINGLGMDGGPGEILIQTNPPPFKTLTGPAWTGAGNPASIVLNVPNNPALIGFKVYIQGRLVDSTPGAPIRIGLAGAYEITILP